MSSQRKKILLDVVDEHDALVRELEEAQRQISSLKLELQGLEYIRLKDNKYLLAQIAALKEGK